MAPTTTTEATGINNIDALLSGHQWQSNTVTFSFTDSFNNDYEAGYANSAVHANSFQSFNSTQRSVAYSWFAMYEDVSNLNLVELTGANDSDATIRIAESDHPGTAYAYLPHVSAEGGDIWFNRENYNNPIIGSYAFRSIGHEIGHALGLEHGHDTGGVSNVAMDANRDSMEFSIMTYRSYINAPTDFYRNETWGFSQSLMMYDIRAIQQMYGANFNTNSGNTTYSFSTTTGEMFINGLGQGTPGDNRIFRTIWDGNGFDTYNFSNYNTNLSINLAPGGWSDLDVGGNNQRAQLGSTHFARGHVFNALQYNGDTRSLIENAIGGSGNDVIIGNNANNIINGGGGDDYLDGGLGIDTVNYRFWNEDSIYNLDSGVASLSGLYDEEILNFENILAGGGNDDIIGTSGANYIDAGAGNDQVLGGDGDDFLNGFGFGSSEYDTLTGGAGADLFVLGNASSGAFYLELGFATITDFNWA